VQRHVTAHHGFAEKTVLGRTAQARTLASALDPPGLLPGDHPARRTYDLLSNLSGTTESPVVERETA